MTNIPARLAVVITDSGVGGTEKVVTTLLEKIDRSRFTPVGVAVLKEKRDTEVKWSALGIPVAAFGMKKFPTPSLVAALGRQLNDWQSDVVHAFLFHSIQTARLLKLRGVAWKLVSSPRVNYAFAPKTALWIDKLMKRWDDAVLCESQAGRRYLIEKLRYDAAKIYVALNGVDPDMYSAQPSARAQLRREWGVGDDDVLIGSVGRLHPQKGYDVLVSALAELRRSRQKYKAVLAGEGPERDALKARIDATGVPVKLLGQRNDVVSILSALDIYVQSSRYEGLSNALLEAMSCGRACVATAVDGTLDFAQDGENMVLVRPDDAASLALGLGTLLEKPALRLKLAENATIAARRLTLENMVRDIELTYQAALTAPTQ
jgi:glycosyltransferase involved in cell wall biosynthesis